jgi:hypothetical protein
LHTWCAQAIFPAYELCLDSYLQLVVQKANASNRMQLILLVVVGVLSCSVLSTLSWAALQGVAHHRFKTYQIFLASFVRAPMSYSHSMAVCGSE